MPTWVVLAHYTDQGARNVRETVERGERSAQIAQKHGASYQELYWTIGEYDVVAAIEAPDGESAAAFTLELESLGNVRTTELRAFSKDEMSAIIGRLGG